ncbi:MAG: right-handed parallel beta-helix repeat-containing protein [Candidatus Cloacimonetes bacterium]|nr:right-handed parallel beta-helix repeat-containing protein [Candidatus Cloacimonadota bacterium]
MKKTILLVIFIAIGLCVFADTEIEGGEVSGFWLISGSPYNINGDIYVLDNESLTIQPGVEIIFSDNYSLSISGQLLAVGTIVDTILWTVADTTGFSNTNSSAGGWGGLLFDSLCDENPASLLSYNRLEYGKKVGETELEITGGAICVDNCSTVVISNNMFHHNKAVWGGAIGCINEASPSIEFNVMQYNETYGIGSYNGCAGGVFCYTTSSPIIEGNIIRNNHSANNGGGISAFNSSAPQIIDNIITGNVSFEGGAIIFGTNGSGTVTGNTITGNTTSFDGGAISFSGAYNCIINDNYIAGNSSNYFGGGLAFFKSGNISVTNNVIEYNSARLGGGISDTEEYNGNIFLSGNSIRYNEALIYGGGISWFCNGLAFDEISLNSIYENDGRIANDLYYYSPVETVHLDTFTVMIPTQVHAYPADVLDFDIQNCKFEQVEADLYVSPDGDNANSGLSPAEPMQTIERAEVVLLPGESEYTIYLAEGTYSFSANGEKFPVTGLENVSFCGAGAEATILDAENSSVQFYFNGIESGKISNLKVINGNPEFLPYWDIFSGAIDIRSSNVSLSDLEISNNYGGYYGGGVCVRDNSFCEMENLKIMNNEADYLGGGISCIAESRVVINKCEISGNEVTYSNQPMGGAVCCFDSSEAIITNSTLVDNVSENGGGVFCDDNSTFTMINSICRNNAGNEIYTQQESGFDHPITIAYTNIQDGAAGIEAPNGGECNWLEGNIDSEPGFIDPEIGDYNLTENSFCIDQGTDWFEWNEEVLVDLAEDEYYGAAPDMGCYEFLPVDVKENDVTPLFSTISNYPNPFNPETVVSFYLAEESVVELIVVNVKGQRVKSLIKSERNEQGEHSVVWRGEDDRGKIVGSGVYFIRLKVAGESSLLRKCVLMK